MSYKSSLFQIITSNVTFALIAIFFVFSTIYMSWANFTNFPFWDSWAQIWWYDEFLNNGFETLLISHNEHKIVFFKLLSILNSFLFNGTNLTLIIVNYVMVTLACTSLFFFYRKISDFQQENSFIYITSLALVFSLQQRENLFWEFQSQFFAAYVLPMLALCMLYKHVETKKNIHFALSLLFMVVSPLTMANGILFIPIVLLYMLLLHISLRKIFITVAISLVPLTIYFSRISLNTHGSNYDNILQPMQLVIYFLYYLGNIFQGIFNKHIVPCFGVLFLFCFFYCAYKIFTKRSSIEKYHISLCLLLFVFYALLSGFVTAIGRAHFGIEQALSSRYTTPIFYAWITLIFCIISLNKFLFQAHINYLRVATLVLLAFFLVVQINVLKNEPSNFNKHVASFAPILSINDWQRNRLLFSFKQAFDLTISATYVNKLSYFHFGYQKDMASKIGSRMELPSSISQRVILPLLIIQEDDKWLFIDTEIELANTNPLSPVYFLTDDNYVIGIGLLDVVTSGKTTVKLSGYIKKEFQKAPIKLFFPGKKLTMQSTSPIVKNNNFVTLPKFEKISCNEYIDSFKQSTLFSDSWDIHGWVYLEQEKQAADSVYAITSEKDEFKWQLLSQKNRPDVGRHFKNPNLDKSGYSGSFKGKKENFLGLGLKIDEVYYLCKK